MAYQYKDVTQYKRKGRNRKQLEYFKEDIIGRYKLGTSIMDIAVIYDVSFNTIKNIHVSAKEEKGDIVFLHKVEDGPIDKSYGVHVAKLSGMPKELTDRANEILETYENKEPKVSQSSQISFDFREEEENQQCGKQWILNGIGAKHASSDNKNNDHQKHRDDVHGDICHRVGG